MTGKTAWDQLARDRLKLDWLAPLSQAVPFGLRGVAGSMGYSGRIWEASREEFARLNAAFARFKSYRHLLLGDCERVTGRPRRAEAPCEVRFRDGPESLCLNFNPPGTPRSAHLARTRVPQGDLP